jgi:hypothetical protein
MTLSGIDPATFLFVAQGLNYWATACPPANVVAHLILLHMVAMLQLIQYNQFAPGID